jgi:hypothetical protein
MNPYQEKVLIAYLSLTDSSIKVSLGFTFFLKIKSSRNVKYRQKMVSHYNLFVRINH